MPHKVVIVMDGSITNYSWDFGDGNQATGVNTSHEFSSAGVKQVSLTITDNSDNSAVKTSDVRVESREEEPVTTSSGGGVFNFYFALFVYLVFRRRINSPKTLHDSLN